MKFKLTHYMPFIIHFKKLLFFLLIIGLILFCSKNKHPTTPVVSSKFEIFFLKDSTLRIDQVRDLYFSELTIETEPWMSSEDIDFYDFSVHCIYLKTDKNYFFKNFDEDSYEFRRQNIFEKPFLVVANDQRCYLGCLLGLFSNQPEIPYIYDWYVKYYYPKDVLHICRASISDYDVRNDPRIYTALKELNLYHGGLKVELNTVEIIDNSDTATVQYTYTLTNEDQDDLYIFDPDLMGSARFHYYTNGVTFWYDYSSISSRFKMTIKPDTLNSWSIEWFYRMKANDSIQRTVILKGYPHISNGTYMCDFTFAGPIPTPKEKRYLSNGRVWIGDIISEKIEKKVN